MPTPNPFDVEEEPFQLPEGFGGGGSPNLGPSKPGGVENSLIDIWNKTLRGDMSNPYTNALTRMMQGTWLPGQFYNYWTGNVPSLQRMIKGKTPRPVMKQFKQGLNEDLAGITESFGAQGARFGTDLARTMASQARQGRVGLGAEAMNRIPQAYGALTGPMMDISNLQLQGMQGGLNTGLGLGRGLGQTEFQRSENSLERLLRKYGYDQSALLSILPLLLQ
jgi:hypothetical protein